ncbi:oligosaccharide flippase family protein [Peribacillus frigoritolerans]|uniref:oligosaccharide flippase family protein n=1 Tax=Peribacillus frigoritolerans TaxID=450367 RepID=UPI002E1EF2CA|nr:oligosaccharide flippase family protein [Peribacillus frigoritolerans]MED3711653.1 oligosaccharide flippase family protein [Peribacillus frigoritolerans]
MKELINKIIKKGFIHIFGSNVINKIVQFCSSIFLVRLLMKEDFGNYSYAQNILNIFMLFNGMGILFALLQFGSESPNKEKRNSYFKYSFKIGLRFNIFISIVLILYSFFILKENIMASNLLTLMFLMPVFLFVFEYIQIYFRTNLMNIEFSKLSTYNTLAIFILSVFGAVLLGVIGVVIGVYIAYFTSMLIGFYLLKKDKFFEKRSTSLTTTEKKELTNYSIISVSNNVISQITYLIDIFLIGLLIKDPNTVAIYKAATLIPFALNFIPLSIMTFVYPYFAKNRENVKWLIKTYKILVKYLLLINIFITIILITFAPLIIKLLFGEEYLEGVLVFRLLSLGFFFASTFRIPAGNVLAMVKQVKILFTINIIVGVTNIILDFIMIKYYSMIGAAFTTVLIIGISALSYNVVLWRYFSKKK